MYRRNPRWILGPTKGKGTLACEDAFEGSEQSLPFSIAARAVAKDFAKCMDLWLREQVAQNSLTGKAGTVTESDLLRTFKGRIQGNWTKWDAMGTAQQLGVQHAAGA